MPPAASHATVRTAAPSSASFKALLARVIPKKAAKPDLLLWGTAILAWVIIWRVQDLIAILGKVKFPMLLEFALLGLLLSNRHPNRQLRWIMSPIIAMIGGLFFIMVVGVPTNLAAGNAVTFLMRTYLPLLLLFFGVALGIRSESDLVWFTEMFLIGAFAYCLNVFSTFQLDSNGRLANLIYYDANDFGLLLDCTIPFTLFFLRPGTKWWKRMASLAMLGLFLFMGVRGGSRGGFLGLIAILLYVLFFYNGIPRRLRVGSIIVGVALLSVFGSTKYWENIQSILHPKNDYNMTGDVGRKAIWTRGIGYTLSHPFLGVGVGAFPQAEGRLSIISKEYAERGRGLKWSVAHNSFVETAAELGIPGIVMFVSLFWIAIATLRGVRTGQYGDLIITPDDQAYAQTLIAVFIAFIVTGFFVSAEYFGLLYMILALTITQQAILRRRAARVKKLRLSGALAPATGPATGPALATVPPHRRLPSKASSVSGPVTWYPSSQ